MARRPQTRRRRGATTRVTLVGVTVVAVGAIAWATVTIAGRDDDSTPGELAVDPGVSHVHGLGINPADGSLIVATHYGLFRLRDGGSEAERIGDRFQDTMGFTVAGRDHFLGSGHPDLQAMQAGQPTRLGLIESTDAGANWTIRSLGGEVDFHALAFAHDHVYGWDSGTGRFMVSTDKQEWETRATLDLFGFGVDPDDADHIVGASPDGITESTDGGRTWQSVDGPALVALSWDSSGDLWGATVDGAVWRRTDSTWEQAGELPGEPQALHATANTLYAAAHDTDGRTAIYQSTDQGRTWDLRYRDPAQ